MKRDASTVPDRPEKAPGARRTRRRLLRVLLPLLLVLLLGTCAIYLADGYPADRTAIDAYPISRPVTERTLEDGSLSFGDGTEDCGLIFYPGGKVDHAAYTPLMRELAQNGVFCVVCKMPFRLAVLDKNAADGIREAYPAVRRWYLGGHSLGGVIAASYLRGHPEDFDGLILLAAYANDDLSACGAATLCIRGSEDGVLDRERYEAAKSRLPAGWKERVIRGGCHAGFGMYGPQSGDGEPAIDSAEQIRQTAAAILELIRERGE